MGDSIHKTHFQVPEMPWREKEKQAILLLQEFVSAFYSDEFDTSDAFYYKTILLVDKNKDLVDWVMKYKGE